MAYFFQCIIDKRYASWRACVKKGTAVILFLFTLLFSTAEPASAADNAFGPADAAMTAQQYLQARDLYRQVFVASRKVPMPPGRCLGSQRLIISSRIIMNLT